jgi:hypothetical protein
MKMAINSLEDSIIYRDLLFLYSSLILERFSSLYGVVIME